MTTTQELDDLVEGARRLLAGFEAAQVTGLQAAAFVRRFVQLAQLAEAGKTLAASRAASQGVFRTTGHGSAAEWLAAESGGSLAEARSSLELAQLAEERPATSGALRSGRLSLPKAKALIGAIRENPDQEDALLAAAEQGTLRQVRQAGAAARAAVRTPEDDRRRAQRHHARRRCRTWVDPHDGMVCLEARLAPVPGARMAAALRRAADRRSGGSHEQYEAHQADALVELLTTGGGTSEGAKVGVTLRVDLATLRRGEGEPCDIPGVGPVPLATAREVLGEALTHLVITEGSDVRTVVNVTRHVPRLLRVALEERDQACVVPGCDRTEHLEIDHWQRDFADGGPTSYDNLARLCSQHHRMKSIGRFTLVGGPGRWRFVRRRGS